MGLSPGELRDTLLDLIRRSRLPVPDLAKDAQVDEAQLAAFLQSSAADQPEYQSLIPKLNDWTVAYFQKFALRSPLISSQSIPLPMPSEKKPALAPSSKSLEDDSDNAALARISNVLKQIRAKSMLCPTRIDESFKTMRYQDEFIWDINNPGLTPDTFTILLLKDVGLPENVFKEPIKRSILRQTTEFQSVMNMNPKLALADSLKGLIEIKLDITLNGFRLVDEVYWNPYLFPEAVELFATSMCKDYGLTGDWAAKIAFDIRWALLEHRKAVHMNQASPFPRRPITDRVQFTPIRSVHQAYSEDILQSVAPT